LIKEYLNKIAKDTLWVLALNAVNFASSFVIAVFISRMMGVNPLGSYTFIIAISSVLYMVSDFGLTTSLVRKIGGEKNNAYGFISEANSIKTFFGAAALIVTLLAIYLFNKSNFNISLTAGVIVIIPRLYQTSYEASIRVFGFQKYPTVIRSIASMLQIIFSYYVIKAGYGLDGIFVMILFVEILTYYVFYFTNYAVLTRENIKIKKAAFSLSIMFEKAKESSVLFFNNVLTFTIPRVNIILLEYISSTASVGIFSAGTRFTSGAGLLSGALYNSVYPFIANLKEQKKTSYGIAKELIKYSFILGAAISIALFLLSGILIDLTFKIEEAKPVLKIVAFSVIPLLVYTVVQTYMLSVFMEKFLLKIYALIWLLNAVLGIFLIWKWSYTGAAIVTIGMEYSLMFIQIIKFFSIGKTLNDNTLKS
jgi:O-antigen/teichoic acid export membrane protein